MKIIWILIWSQILLFALGGCASEPTAKTGGDPEPTVSDDPKEKYPEPDVSNESYLWSDFWRDYMEDKKVLLNELKDIALEQEGLFNICRGDDGTVTMEPREDIQVEMDMERVRELMEELDIYLVCVRPEEDYFGYKDGVEVEVSWPLVELSWPPADVCYCSTGAPEPLWEDDCEEWIDLGDGWYMMFTPPL